MADVKQQLEDRIKKQIKIRQTLKAAAEKLSKEKAAKG